MKDVMRSAPGILEIAADAWIARSLDLMRECYALKSILAADIPHSIKDALVRAQITACEAAWRRLCGAGAEGGKG